MSRENDLCLCKSVEKREMKRASDRPGRLDELEPDLMEDEEREDQS